MGTRGERAWPSPTAFSLPGPGAGGVATQEVAAELPFHPHRLRQPDLGGRRGRPLRWADHTTPSPRSGDPNLPSPPTVATPEQGVGYLIPVRPLRPNAAYTAAVRWQDGGGGFDQAFAFTTAAAPPRTGISVVNGRFALRSRSTAPARVRITRAGGEIVVDRVMTARSTARVPADGGRFLLCADQPAVGDLSGFSGCREETVVVPRVQAARRVGGKLVLTVSARDAAAALPVLAVWSVASRHADDGRYRRSGGRRRRSGSLSRMGRIEIALPRTSDDVLVSLVLRTPFKRIDGVTHPPGDERVELHLAHGRSVPTVRVLRVAVDD